MEHQIWWLLFAMSAGIGLFSALLLLTGKERPRHGTKALAILLIVFSFTLVHYVLVWSNNIPAFPHLSGLWQVSNYLYGPLLLYFFLPKETMKSKWHWLHFIPAAILFLAWLPFGILPAAEKMAWMETHYIFDSHLLLNRNLLWLLSPKLMIGSQIIYAAFFMVHSFRDKSGDKKFRRIIALLFSIFVAAGASYFILVNTPYFTNIWDYMISFAMTLCIFRISMLAFHEPGYFFISKKRKNKSGKYISSPLKNGQSLRLAERTKKQMEAEKIFLDSDLRLPTLAAQLGISSHQLSQAINEQFGCSFSEWVNRYRVEHACHLLSGPDVTSKEAGYQSGFNSLSTFYKVFKETKGMTPSEFRNEQVGVGN